MSVENDAVPEDVLRDIAEYEEKYLSRDRGKRKRFQKARIPTRRDLREAVRRAILVAAGPEEFPETVIELLKEEGFSVKYTTVRRIWSTYEELVRKAIIPDRFGVVERRKSDSDYQSSKLSD